ncbi:MAG: WbqC family protein [Kordiimonadaceae bacterium]|nr:WbqC family protein [Kordiimonadaceae bacterium]MBO6569487.1 WbqC family protein [Kordiimonadaceae bacterium]MBO6964962.1 WbqC family protein [Kordiimonadaceae bacterium]
MQPYLFPYLGYVQLLRAADTFVLYDDAQFMKGGWINRNKILGQGGTQFITLNLQGASANKAINEVQVGNNGHKLCKTIRQTYAQAKFKTEAMDFVQTSLMVKEKNLARLAGNSLISLAARLHLPTRFLWSSELGRDTSLSGQDAVLDICSRLGASHYVNAEGGKELYSAGRFVSAGINLSFLIHDPVPYPQTRSVQAFEPRLSVVDVLMNVGMNGLRGKLSEYSLVS